MPLFTWSDKSSCGDTDSSSCAPLPYKETVKALRASDVDTGCEVDMIASQHPSIPIVISDILTEPRSGASSSPIPINLLQEYAGNGPVPTILYKNIAGEMHAWKPDASCNGKKVIVDNSNFVLQDDINSNVFDETCVGDISEIDYIAGAREFTDCNGNTKIKMVFVPKDQVCTYCS